MHGGAEGGTYPRAGVMMEFEMGDEGDGDGAGGGAHVTLSGSANVLLQHGRSGSSNRDVDWHGARHGGFMDLTPHVQHAVYHAPHGDSGHYHDYLLAHEMKGFASVSSAPLRTSFADSSAALALSAASVLPSQVLHVSDYDSVAQTLA